MKAIRTAATAALLLCAARGEAQTIEETYAAQCANGQSSETCDVLRKALLEKLQRQQAPQPTHVQAQPGQVPPAAALPDAERAKWGVYADLADKTWLITDKGAFDSFYISTYRMQGNRLYGETKLYTADVVIPSRTVFELRADGSIAEPGAKAAGYVHADGMVEFRSRPGSKGKLIGSMRRVNGHIVSVYRENPKRPYVYQQIQPADAPRLVSEWHERRRAREASKRDSGGFGANILMGFMKGFSEATAQNAAMEQSLQDAASRGLAQGVAEYERRQSVEQGAGHQAQLPSGQQSAAYAGRSDGGASDSSGGTGDSSTAIVVLAKGFRVPITPGATSNEMCFTRFTIGPISNDSSRRMPEAIAAMASAKSEFFNECSKLGAIPSDGVPDDLLLDASAEAAYAKFQSNKWMHEVTVR